MSIEKIINENFKKEEIDYIQSYISDIKNKNWGVSSSTLIESILLLSDGSIEKFKRFFPIIDPRDIIMDAQEKNLLN